MANNATECYVIELARIKNSGGTDFIESYSDLISVGDGSDMPNQVDAQKALYQQYYDDAEMYGMTKEEMYAFLSNNALTQFIPNMVGLVNTLNLVVPGTPLKTPSNEYAQVAGYGTLFEAEIYGIPEWGTGEYGILLGAISFVDESVDPTQRVVLFTPESGDPYADGVQLPEIISRPGAGYLLSPQISLGFTGGYVSTPEGCADPLPFGLGICEYTDSYENNPILNTLFDFALDFRLTMFTGVKEQEMYDYIMPQITPPTPTGGVQVGFVYPVPGEATQFFNWSTPTFKTRIPHQNFSFAVPGVTRFKGK